MNRIINFTIIILMFLLFSCNENVFYVNSPEHQKIKVGVFSGNGASSVCILETLEALKIDTGIAGMSISPVDIMNGKLDSIDVLIFPGGSGSKEFNSLNDFGSQKVKDFVNSGKAIVGICAGGYILSTTPTYPSLQIASVKNIDRKHYTRGRGLIEVALTKKGLEIFPELKNHKAFLQYYDGPILAPLDSNDVKYTEIAQYVTDIHANAGIPSGVTPGKTFMLTEKIGDGNIFIIGGHAESTPGMRWIIPRMARYAYDSSIISYPKKWIHPEINDTAIMFTLDLRKIEKSYSWKLYNDTPQVRINAMIELHNLRSRPAVRWTIGMLRDSDPEVRKQAALILEQCEYTHALPDVLQALKDEQNEDVKKQLQETADFLSTF